MLLLPFEPRRGFGLPGFQLTLLEAIAGLAMAAAFAIERRGWRPTPPEPSAHWPWPLRGLCVFAATCLASAAFAPSVAGPLKFSLRMLAMAAFAVLVRHAVPVARRRALVCVVVAAVVVALLCVAEGAGVRALDPLLNLFRESPFNVGGARRATGGSEYPNQAAAFLMTGLLTWAGLGAGRALALRLGIPMLLSLGLLFTYSRGALVAAAIGLVALAVTVRTRSIARNAWLALLVGSIASGAFALKAENFRLRLESEGTRSWYAATYAPADRSLALGPGEARTLDVSVSNQGQKTWAVEQAFHLSYHWYDLDRKTLSDGGRTQLPHDVGPGATVELRALVVAPVSPGRYLLIWDMVHEDTTWFSGQGVRPATAEVIVGPATAPKAGAAAPAPEPPLAWRPSRAELWRIALLMWRDRPLLGQGPDNYRWLYGRYAGQAFWDTRVFANNTLLEALATTGIVGASALLATLVSSLLLAGRRVREIEPAGSAEAAALFAVTVGIVGHGLVDYFLAFTGHYLLFGLIVGGVGAVAAPRH